MKTTHKCRTCGDTQRVHVPFESPTVFDRCPDCCTQWVISVGGGYGEYLFAGTRLEAERERAHKAHWEAAVARKRPATEADVMRLTEGGRG